MTWLLLRLPSGSLAVELDAIASEGQILGGFPTITEAREAHRAKDEAEALRDAGQGNLFQ